MQADELIREAVVWDNHACLPLQGDDDDWLPAIDRHRQSGVDVVSLNVGYGDQGPQAHFAAIERFRAWYGARPDRYVLARSAADIRAAKTSGRLAVIFDIEGMNALGDRPERVADYYDLGVRWMLIAYNHPNLAGGGCLDEDQGLTELGRAAIEEMERVGMLLCCSHTGWRTAMQAIGVSRAPVILSHSNADALWPHPRNAPDELMVACARTGGVVGINGIGPFLGEGPASATAMARHIEHALVVVGEDHVSIGLDYSFDQVSTQLYLQRMSEDARRKLKLNAELSMAPPETFPELAGVMLERGHAPGVVRKVLGENLLRLAEQIWS